MANGGKDRDARASRERARLYQARQQFHSDQARRRTRDNTIAGVAGGLLVVGILAVQAAYFIGGPGAPEPTPTSSTPAVTPAPTDSSTPTPAPTTSSTPTPTPTP